MGWEGPHCDAADRPEASCTPDMASLCDNPIEALFREATESYSSGGLPGFTSWLKATTADEARQLTVETLSRVLPILVKPGNVRLRVYALMFAINSDALNGVWTQTAAAKEMGVTRAAPFNRHSTQRQHCVCFGSEAKLQLIHRFGHLALVKVLPAVI